MTRVVEAKLRISAEDKTAAGLDSAAARLRAFERKAAAMDRAAAGLAQRRRIEEKARLISAKYHQAQVMGALAAGGRIVGPALGAAAMTKSFTDFAKFDRQMTNIGITADATKEEMEAAGAAIRQIASDAATPIGDVVGGLDTLVAAGRKLPEAMAFLPTVTRTALATNSAVDDIAKSADAMGQSFKIAAADMERAFDIVSYLGKEGRFETKDQSRYLPSIAPLAATRGLVGLEGLTHVGAALQVIQKNAGTAEEAAASMTDVLGKIDSDETIKRMSKEFGVDLPKALAKARKEGKNTFDAFLDIVQLAIKGDLEKVNRVFGDKEARRGLTALMMFRDEYGRLIEQSKAAAGTIEGDVKRKMNDAQASVDRLGNAFNSAAVASGRLLNEIGVSTFLENVASGANSAASSVHDLSERVKELGLLDGFVRWLAHGPAAESPEAKALLEKSQSDPNSFFAARYHTAPPSAPGIWGNLGPGSPQAADLARRERFAKSYPALDWAPTPGIPAEELDRLRRSGLPQPRPARAGEIGGFLPMPQPRPSPIGLEVILDDASESRLDSELQRQRARLQASLDAQPLVIRARVEQPRLPPLDTGRAIRGGDQSGGP